MVKKVFKIILTLVLFSVLFFSCNKSNAMLRLQELEEGVHNPLSEAELKEAINKYEKRVNDIMIAEGRVGIWYKMLGTRYMDKKMYRKALKSFQSALEYYPENQNLFYKVGLSASLVAKNSLDFDATGQDIQKKRYYDLAVSAYERAIEIDPKYSRAIYALSVLYIFELNRPADAVPLLESVVEREQKPLKHMFLLARAYYMLGESNVAIEMYEKIIAISGSEEQRKEAQRNIDFINSEGGN